MHEGNVKPVIDIYKAFPLFLSLLLLFTAACDRNALVNATNTNTSPPITAVVSPDDNAWVARSGSVNNSITIVFDASMDTASLALSGTMASASAVWSTTTLPDDTLIIDPSPCPPGQGATLTIACDSLEGVSITLNRTYNIAESVYYVDINNSGGPWDGTRDEPMDNIQNAINSAVAVGTPGVVLVAAGTFTTAATLVTMADGISLFGGYSATDWDERDPLTHVTRLEDTRATIGGSTTPTDPIRVIDIPAGLTAATVVDGFTISIAPFDSGPSQPSAAAVFINNASPIISNNVIISPDLSVGSVSNTIGISHINGGSPEIHHNTITLGTRGGTAVNSSNYGMYFFTGVNPIIHNNTIHAGGSTGTGGTGTGIFLSGCTGNVHDNTVINGGIGEEAANGIHLINSTTIIRNNDLITSSTTGTAGKYAFGVRMESQSHATLENNVISGFTANSVRCVMVSSLSRPSIVSNYIDAGNNPTTVGILVNNEDGGAVFFTEIYNNVINAGIGTTTTGIFIFSINTRVNICNNTINGGGVGNDAIAINLRRAGVSGVDTRVNIANNNIFTDLTSATSFGIHEDDANSFPNIVSNNNIFNCDTLYFDYIDGTADQYITNILVLNAFVPDGVTPAKDNINENIYPDLNGADHYRFTGDISIVDFDTSGIDGVVAGWAFSTDRNSNPRTVNWSIGAYEYD